VMHAQFVHMAPIDTAAKRQNGDKPVDVPQFSG
jgi:hypothetical protein